MHLRIVCIALVVVLCLASFASAERQRGKFVKSKQEKAREPDADQTRQEPTAEQLKELQNWLAQATCQQCVAEPRLGWDVATGKCGFEFTNKVCPKTQETDAEKKKRLATAAADDDDDDDDDEEDDEDEDEDDASVHHHEEPEQQAPPEMVFDDKWANTEVTTALWKAIHEDQMDTLRGMLQQYPRAVIVRSQDGRGPLFWAYEYGRPEMVKLLIDLGADTDARDERGQKPEDLAV